ncbi:MAG: hypothetical protein FVQ83_04560 [Chloroflexi bacterium]|nr:hypothetical protein [Chloroflexota bacterium]
MEYLAMQLSQTNQMKKLILLILLVLTACARTENQQSTSEISTPSTGRALPATRTLSPSATTTFTPTITATTTSTTMPTRTPLPTWTPLPTLSSEEALELVEELYATNAGCRLPCWWGITPGVTSWEEARQFFATFATEIIQSDSIQISEKGVTYIETRNIVRYPIVADYPVGGFSLYVIDGGISSIETGSFYIDYSIQLDQMLQEYGAPTQIFLWTLSNAPFRPLPFILVLFYEDQGIMAIYDYDNAEIIGDNISSCPKPVVSGLSLWSEIIEMDVEDIEFRALGVDPTKPLRLLEDVTDYTIDSFHQTFKDTSNQTCIITPVEHWE